MKKKRNSFFAESNINFQGYAPMAANVPYQNANASSSFYTGPMPISNMPEYNDISERLAKLERQVSRLEHRISSLESNVTKSTDDFESTTNNMYMI